MPDLDDLDGFIRYKSRLIEENEPPKEQWLFRFPNDYGASVISGYGAYSDKDHPYELGVVFFDGDEWALTYPPSISDDVIGHLDFDGVADLLEQIKEL